MGKKTVNGVADVFISGLDKKIEEEEAKKKKSVDTSGFDKAVLEQIGKENLKRAVAGLSFISLFRFLRQAGFMGDKARLADLLDAMGVRKKADVPEHFKKKCLKCGDVLVDDRPDPNEKRLWICLSCGMTHELSKGHLIRKGVLSTESLTYVREKKGWQREVKGV